MQREEAVTMWKTGDSVVNIAALAKVDTTTIRRWIRQSGARRTNPFYTLPELAEKMIEMHKAGHSNRHIAKVLGKNHCTVGNIVRVFKKTGGLRVRRETIEVVKKDPSRITDALVSRLWTEGAPVEDIAARTGLAYATVRRHARRLGLAARVSLRPCTDADKSMILLLASRGLSYCAIAKEMDRKHNFVSRWLKKLQSPVLLTPDARKSPSPPESPVMVSLSGPSPGRIIIKTRQVEWLNRTPTKRTSIPIGPPPTKCQFPEGDRPFTMCDAPVENSSRPYCAEHNSRCYVKPLKPVEVPPVSKRAGSFPDWTKW